MKPRFHESVSSAASQSSFCMHYCNYLFCFFFFGRWHLDSFLKMFYSLLYGIQVIIIYTHHLQNILWNRTVSMECCVLHLPFFPSFSSKGRSPPEFTRYTIIPLSLSYYWRIIIMNHKEKSLKIINYTALPETLHIKWEWTSWI